MSKSILEIAKYQDFPSDDLVLKEIYKESIAGKCISHAVIMGYSYGIIQGKRIERLRRKGV